jgi:hypothetical protein
MIEKIKRAFETLPEGPDNQWTKEFKKRFISLGREEGFKVYTTIGEDIGQAGGEWLYDLCWLEYDHPKDESAEYKHLKQVVLAMECEWGDASALIDDFHKLLQSTARYRLMIRQSNAPSIFLNYAKANISIYPHVFGSCYIFACYSNQEKRFLFEVAAPK